MSNLTRNSRFYYYLGWTLAALSLTAGMVMSAYTLIQ